MVEGSPDELKTSLRGDVLAVELEDEASAARAMASLGRLAGLSAVLRDGSTLRARSEAGARVVPAVFAALSEAGIVVVSATVSRPSLDDVYLRHAGRSFEDRSRRPRGGVGMSALVSHSAYLSMRSVRALRPPAGVPRDHAGPADDLAAAVRPALRVGRGRSPASSPAAPRSWSSSRPGVIAMTALFSAMWAGTVYIDDMERGVMDRLLASPVRRGAMINGTLAYQSLTSVVQTAIVLVVAVLAGARFDGGAAGVLVTVVATCLLTVTCAALSNAIALLARQQEALIGISQFLSLPMTFLSSAIMDPQLAPGWIRAAARFNPLDWAVVASRETLLGDPDWSLVWPRLLALLGLAVAMAWAATRTFGAYQRSL